MANNASEDSGEHGYSYCPIDGEVGGGARLQARTDTDYRITRPEDGTLHHVVSMSPRIWPKSCHRGQPPIARGHFY